MGAAPTDGGLCNPKHLFPGVKIDRTTPALVRFKPTGSDYSAVEKDFIVAYYLPAPMQARLLMREQRSLWAAW